MSRFVILRWTPARNDLARAARLYAATLEAQRGLTTLLEWRGLLVLNAIATHQIAPIVLPNGTGFLFGVVFARDSANPARVTDVSYDDALGWVEAGGAVLFKAHWGAYVAVLVDREQDLVHILRDPVGAQACFRSALGEITFICSDIEDLAALKPCTPRADRVLAFMAMPHLVSRQTALEDVEVLLPGERLTLGRDDASLSMLWRPPQRPQSVASFDKSAAELRTVSEACVKAWASVRPRVLHRLSGGLDSSTVLALLRRSKSAEDILCLNEHSAAAPEGDERAIAREVCAHFGVSLRELNIAPEDIRFERALSAPLMASPSMTVLSFGQRNYEDVAAMGEAAIMTSGQGGDQVFYRTRSTLIAADAARAQIWPWTWADVAYEVARLSGKSFWRVAADAGKHGLARLAPDASAYFQPGADMARAVRAEAHQEQLRHPWIAGRGMAPAQIGRVLSVLQAEHYHWPNSLSAAFATFNPILSQPVIEHVLNVKAHVLTQGGRDRSLYRAAIADLLPPQVLHRTTKGQTTRHFAEVAALNRRFMRETLLDGQLCARGIIDRGALEDAMRRAEITTLAQMDDLLIAFAAELWLRAWAGARPAERTAVA